MESLDFLLNLNKLSRISLHFVMLLEMLVIQYLICRGTKDDMGWSKELCQVWRRQFNDGRVPAGLGKERCTWICGMLIVGWDGGNCVREGK